jgi:hypothetical protein
MERAVMLTGGSTAASGEGEEAEGNVLPGLSRITSHYLWTKRKMPNLTMSTVQDCAIA